MKRFFLFVIPILLGLSPLTARAVDNAPFSMTAAAAQYPPKLDGTIDDPEWKDAAHVQLQWDLAFQRPAEEATDAYLLVDARYVYVAFVAHQKEPVVATQHTNDQPLPNDDVVRVYLWPAGDSGNEYGFVSNPIGTRYEFSSENTAFAPSWDSVAKRTADGYVVTERIPIGVMRGDGRTTWRLQFDRRIRSSNQVVEWAHNSAQGNTDSNIYAGYLGGMQIASHAARTKPRIAVYGLGQAATPFSGGSTSRAGLDLALPITQTSSFVATFHPDYSNVELDQQSISPTAFPRRFSEVRPFFTQGQNFYNNFNCNDCIDIQSLYTPNIPSPRDGYAVEGKQGNLTFGSFDAVGTQRNDDAQSAYWHSSDHRLQALYQRVGVDTPAVHDTSELWQAVYGNVHNFNAYATVGHDRGTQVTDPGLGGYDEYGVNFYTPKSGLFAAYHDVGSQWAPVDGFNQINDVHGPTVYVYKELDNAPKDFLQSVIISQDFGRMHDSSGVMNYAYNSTYITFATRNHLFFGVQSGQSYLRFPGQSGGMTDQNGVQLTYGFNTATPSGVTYNVGRFGAGYLHSLDLNAAVKFMRLGTFSAEAYQTDDLQDDGLRLQQWLERVSVGYQIGPGQSLALGWRKIIGTGPTFFDPPHYIAGTNLSLAYYRRWSGNELYLAYGNPNRLSTQHDVILKLIRYIGAEKGT